MKKILTDHPNGNLAVRKPCYVRYIHKEKQGRCPISMCDVPTTEKDTLH